MSEREEFDLVVREGTIITATDRFRADVGVRDGRIAAIGERLGGGRKELSAAGRLVLPGGVDSHCHIEQLSSMGIMGADDFYSGTVSAVFGGNTTVIPFAAQHRGMSLRKVVRDYHELARPKAVIDYAFHMIISDPTEIVMREELPALIREGYTSFKVFMTYDRLRLDDYQILDVLALARREGALTMVHAENHDIIRWLSARLIEAGHTAPKFHAVSHAELSESEATARAIGLARLLDTPILVVHVSSPEATQAIREAQSRGLRVYGETCPQYLFLTAEDLDQKDLDGAMCCCSPPPRDRESQERIWAGLADGTFQVFSSDHAPFRFDNQGKLPKGKDTTFKDIANGIPGLEVRMPLLFSEGVLKGRIDIHRFVDLTSTRAAQLYGLYPRKGTIAVGADADLAIWNPDRPVTIRWADLHDNVGYSPYEGRQITGWPETVISRGRIAVSGGVLSVERGSGLFLPCAKPDSAVPAGQPSDAALLARKFGANIL